MDMKATQLFRPAERRFARAVGDLIHTNPFGPERIAREREALGDAFVGRDPVMSRRPGEPQDSPNKEAILARTERLAARLQKRLADSEAATPEDLASYQGLVLFLLYFRHEDRFYRPDGPAPRRRLKRAFADFAADAASLTAPRGIEPIEDLPHLFACFYQLGRAFHLVYAHIIGRSLATGRLRAAVWESIFSYDMRRYRRALATRMADTTTLIVGPSGTGKELVARAVGLSRYLPFDPDAGAFEDPDPAFRGLNVAALSPTLVESELFGHRRGAFTGALDDHPGWLETCPPFGSVFLDEVGEIDAAIQVKLLRVLQERSFQRLGESTPRRFEGKLIAATNRDLPAEVAAGRVREDFYYRLCSDVIHVPSLRERLEADPGELDDLLLVLAERAAGPAEGPALAAEVGGWIAEHLGPGHPWPGNVRELEQCVRNVMVRGRYRPLGPTTEAGLGALVEAGAMDAEALLDRYCALVYGQAGSWVEAARRLGLDRRTVKARAERAGA